MHFREWKVSYFDYNFIEVCSRWSNWQWPSTGLDNGLAPNRPQAIIWTNADPVRWRVYAALGGDELMAESFIWIEWNAIFLSVCSRQISTTFLLRLLVGSCNAVQYNTMSMQQHNDEYRIQITYWTYKRWPYGNLSENILLWSWITWTDSISCGC